MRQCVRRSEDTSAKWYASRSFSLPPSSFLLQLVCFCLSIQVFTLAGVFFLQSYLFHPLPSKSSNLQNLLLSPHKGSYVVLCVMLVSPSRLCSGSLQTAPLQHSPHVAPLLVQTAIMCLKCSSACRWMGTLFNTTCHLSNPRLVTGGGRDTKLRAQMLVMGGGGTARLPAGPPKQPFCGSISRTVMETVHLVCL